MALDLNVDIGGVFTGIGTLAKDVRQAITGEISPEKKAEIEAKILEMENAALTGQSKINEYEAQNSNLFVSGWRPGTGWLCNLGLLYAFFIQPICSWASAIWKFNAPPTLDMGVLMQLLFALLGVAGLRSWEKAKGVAK